MTIDGKEEDDGKQYDGFLDASTFGNPGMEIGNDLFLTDCGDNDDNTKPTAVECPVPNAAAQATTASLGRNRHWYYQTEDGQDIEDEEEQYDDEWKPCELRTREECQDSHWYHVPGLNDVQGEVAVGDYVKECVMSSPLPTRRDGNGALLETLIEANDGIADINPYIVHSPKFIVDKTGVDHDKIMCRYYGDARGDDNDGVGAGNNGFNGERVLYGDSNGPQADDAAATGVGFTCANFLRNTNDAAVTTTHHGGIHRAGTNNIYDSRIANLINNDYRSDTVPEEDLAVGTDAGGKEFMNMFTHDAVIRSKRELTRYQLAAEDVEFLAAHTAATYAFLLDSATRYSDLEDGEMTASALANRATLLNNVPGQCFSPGLSGSGLLYSQGWGAAYCETRPPFSFSPDPMRALTRSPFPSLSRDCFGHLPPHVAVLLHG